MAKMLTLTSYVRYDTINEVQCMLMCDGITTI